MQGDSDFVAFLTAPFEFIFSPFGLDVSTTWFYPALFTGWVFWILLIRVSFFLFARPFGWATPEAYLFFRRLSFPWQTLYRPWGYIKRLRWQWTHGDGASQYWSGFWWMAMH